MTEDDVILIAQKANAPADACLLIPFLHRFAQLVAAAEREACAKVVEADPSYDWHKFACEAAAAIRARGEHE